MAAWPSRRWPRDLLQLVIIEVSRAKQIIKKVKRRYTLVDTWTSLKQVNKDVNLLRTRQKECIHCEVCYQPRVTVPD